MGSEAAPVLIIFAIVGVVALVIWGAIHNHKKRQEFLAWAAAKGFNIDTSHDRHMEDRFPELDCLRSGSNRYAYDILTGQWNGYEFFAFNYHYETHSTDSKGNRQTHHHRFSVTGLATPLLLRPLLIRPEGWFDKVAGFFGAEDINFESAEFSRSFYVKSPDRKWAYDVIHARMMEYLLQAPRYFIQMTNGHHLFAYNRSVFVPAQFEESANLLQGLLERLPDYVKRELKEGSPAL